MKNTTHVLAVTTNDNSNLESNGIDLYLFRADDLYDLWNEMWSKLDINLFIKKGHDTRETMRICFVNDVNCALEEVSIQRGTHYSIYDWKYEKIEVNLSNTEDEQECVRGCCSPTPY